MKRQYDVVSNDGLGGYVYTTTHEEIYVQVDAKDERLTISAHCNNQEVAALRVTGTFETETPYLQGEPVAVAIRELVSETDRVEVLGVKEWITQHADRGTLSLAIKRKFPHLWHVLILVWYWKPHDHTPAQELLLLEVAGLYQPGDWSDFVVDEQVRLDIQSLLSGVRYSGP